MKGLYLVFGYPDVEAFDRAVALAEGSGFDFLEVGVPFSEPVADGPYLSAASKRAIERGVTLENALEWIASYKGGLKIYVMTYANILLARGLERVSREMRDAGVRGVIVADLPNREQWFFRERGFELPIIPFATPESRRQDIEMIADLDADFVYFVSVRGTTGSGFRLEREVVEKIGFLREICKKPVVLGFGISEPEHVRAALKVADGFVIGTRAVRELDRGLDFFESWCNSLTMCFKAV